MRHYKDKMLDKQYQNLLGKTPEYLIEHKVFGALLYAFKIGYEGKPEPHYIVRNSFAHAAYMAGKDTYKLNERGITSMEDWQHWQILDHDSLSVMGVFHGTQQEAIKQYPDKRIMIDNRNDNHPFWKRYHKERGK